MNHCKISYTLNLVSEIRDDEASDFPWISSNLNEPNNWVSKLDEKSDISTIVQGFENAKDATTDDTCLTIGKLNNSSYVLAIKPANCYYKRPVICRLDNTSPNLKVNRPKFPCIAQNQETRVKRDASNQNEKSNDASDQQSNSPDIIYPNEEKNVDLQNSQNATNGI